MIIHFISFHSSIHISFNTKLALRSLIYIVLYDFIYIFPNFVQFCYPQNIICSAFVIMLNFFGYFQLPTIWNNFFWFLWNFTLIHIFQRFTSSIFTLIFERGQCYDCFLSWQFRLQRCVGILKYPSIGMLSGPTSNMV